MRLGFRKRLKLFASSPPLVAGVLLGTLLVLISVGYQAYWCVTVGCVSPWYWWHHLDDAGQASWAQAVGTVGAIAGALWIDRINRWYAEQRDANKRRDEDAERQKGIYGCVISLRPVVERLHSRVSQLINKASAVNVSHGPIVYFLAQYDDLYVSELAELEELRTWSHYYNQHHKQMLLNFLAFISEYNRRLETGTVESSSGGPRRVSDHVSLQQALAMIPEFVRLEAQFGAFVDIVLRNPPPKVLSDFSLY